MLGVATGLAEAGFIPFAYSIATFASMRPYEFLRNGAALHELPVRLVGMGAGLDYGHNGVTHYALEDVGIMRVQPSVTTVSRPRTRTRRGARCTRRSNTRARSTSACARAAPRAGSRRALRARSCRPDRRRPGSRADRARRHGGTAVRGGPRRSSATAQRGGRGRLQLQPLAARRPRRAARPRSRSRSRSSPTTATAASGRSSRR